MSTVRVEFLFETGDVRAPLRVTRDTLGKSFALTYDGLPAEITIPQNKNDFLFWKPFIPGGYSALLDSQLTDEINVMIIRVIVTVASADVTGTNELLEGKHSALHELGEVR